MLAVASLGGLLWWQFGQHAPLVLAPEARRAVARNFLRHARQEVRIYKDENNSDWDLSEIALAQYSAGDAVGAAATATDIVDHPPERIHVLSALAVACRKAGDADGCRRFLAAANEAAMTTSKDDLTRGKALSDIAVALAEGGDHLTAAAEAEKVEGAYARALAWGAVAAAQAKARVTAAFGKSLAMASEAADAVPSDLSDSVSESKIEALSAVAIAAAQGGNEAVRDHAFALATKMAGAISDREECVRRLKDIASAQADAKDTAGKLRSFAAAYEAASAITDLDLRSKALAIVASEQAADGELASAARTMAAVTSEAYRTLILQDIAVVQSQNGSLTTALATAQSITVPEVVMDTLRDIAVDRAKAGDADGSRQAFALAIATARSHHITYLELERVAAAQAEAGDTAGAAATLASSGDPEDGDTLVAIAIAQAKAGDVAGARKIAHRLRPKEYAWFLRTRDRFLVAIGRLSDIVVTHADDFADLEHRQWTKASCAVAAAQAKAGDAQAATDTIRQLPIGAARRQAYVEAAAGLLQPPAP